jgi:hypothetical protein
MKDNNYILIQGWMVNRLNLSGNELMVYAVIYGFSQDEESKYEGSGRYISDSLGISRRAVTSILDNLVKKGFLKKFDRFERNLKFCDYQANPEFFPKKDKDGSMEDSSIGRKNLPGGMEDSSIGGMENSANHITNSYINNTSSSEPPDSKTDSLSEIDKIPVEEEESNYSQDEIKNALLSVDKTLFLDNFYPQAAAFMSKHVLDLNYLDFIYKETGNTNYKSFKSMFYTLFFKDNKADEYKVLCKPSKTSPPPPDDIKCPVCGAVHDKDDESCPSCGLPHNPLPETVLIYKQLRNFPPEKRNEYLRKESDIFSSCGSTDFLKIKEKKVALNMEYGIKVNDEESSRSYHT